jgi:hypothetical protein
MLINAKTLTGYKLNSLDGEIGTVKEFYFDDQHWAVRYLVADTGTWLVDRQVLISPYALKAVNMEKLHISIDLTKKQIEDSPRLGSDEPVSRQYEEAYHGFYGMPMYWGGPYMWGSYPAPYMWGSYALTVRDGEEGKEPYHHEKKWNPHLRSTHDVMGHRVHATDGEIGHVQDFIIDDEMWAIRYLVVDTRNVWPGRVVLLAPKWIGRVSWGESAVFVDLTREAIKLSPEFTEGSLPTRDYETSLHGHFNRQGYWVDEPSAVAHSR